MRFSSEKQELGASLRRQLDKAVKYAAQHDLQLDQSTYRDLGVSAYRGKNATEGALATFIQAVDSGRIRSGSVLIVESLDRLSRTEVDEALELFLSIVRKGITIVTVDDGQVYSKASIKDNWTKLVVALAVMSRANEESQTKSARVKDAWEGKRQKGEILTSVCPAWLKLQNGKWVVLKHKADVVQAIFKLAASGHGTPTIARRLNHDKVPVMVSAIEWSPGVVAAILKNRAVIGTLTPKKAAADPIEEYYPAILDKQTFYAVQGHISGRAGKGGLKGTNVANLFAGMTYCECGRRTRFVSGSKPHLYLRCLSAYANTGCDAPTMPYAAIEATILEWLTRADISIQELTKAAPDPTLTIRSELAEHRERLERLLDLAEAGSTGITARIVKLEAEILELERSLRDTVPQSSTSTNREALRSILHEVNTLRVARAEPMIQDALADALREPMMADALHDELKIVGGAELTQYRLRIQAAVRRLLERVVLLKSQHTSKYGYDYRLIELHGPMAEALRDWIIDQKSLLLTNRRRVQNAEAVENYRVLESGGVVVHYELPLHGFQPGNIRGRRNEKRAQTEPL